MQENNQLQNYITELRRGSLTMAVLSCLSKPHYGYALLQTLQENGVSMEANTLYPLLRRLENQKLLTSDWDISESRPRKYYTLNANGKQLLNELFIEWEKMQRSLEIICRKDNDHV